MKLYEADVGGAVYYIAAKNTVQAIHCAMQCWEREGVIEDVGQEPSLCFEEIVRSRAEKIRVREEGEEKTKSLWEAAQGLRRPEVLACSEWS